MQTVLGNQIFIGQALTRYVGYSNELYRTVFAVFFCKSIVAVNFKRNIGWVFALLAKWCVSVVRD
ncbi:hypothetical protein D3C85_1379250 [compost metagenome]